MSAPRRYRRRLIVNGLSSGLAGVWSVVLGVVLTAVLLGRLGPSAFGVWALVQSLSVVSGWTSMAILGPSVAVARWMAVESGAEGAGEPDGTVPRVRVGEVVSVFALLAMVTGGVVAAAAPVVADSVFSLSGSLRDGFVVATRWFALQIVAEAVLVAVGAVEEGRQRLDRSRLLDGVRRTVVGLAGLGAVMIRPDLSVVVAAQGSAAVAFAVAVCVRARIVPVVPSRRFVADMRRASMAPIGLNAAGVLHRMMDRTLVGIMLGPSAVAVVEIASRLQDVVRLVLAASAQTVTTAAPYLRSRGARDRLQELVVFGTRVTTGVTLVAAATLAAVANEVLTVWTDRSTAAAATAPLVFGLVYLSIEAPYQVIGNTLTGLGDMRRLLVASWIGVTVNLVATVVLIDLSGVVGAFQGTLAGSIATIGFLTPALVSTSGRSVGELLRRTIVPCLAPTIAAFGAAHAIVGLDLAPLTTLAVALPLAGVAAAMATWVVVLDDGERERFAALVAARRGVSDHLPG